MIRLQPFEGSLLLRLLHMLLALAVAAGMQSRREQRGRLRSDAVLVETTLGDVAGLRAGPVNAFLGIPYAEPPVNALRFRPSKPKTPWYPRVLEAFKFGAECYQSATLSSSSSDDGGSGADGDEEEDGSGGSTTKIERVQSEDCLFLNIWAPAATQRDRDATFPVLLWIYGGAFLHGASSRAEYIGDRLAARGVVVVTINYRLGALGFLVSTADGLYGNYGLHDQKIAMQWVQDNIRSFGGDPSRVTLFGESAGAMSVGLHLLDQHDHVQRQRASASGYHHAPRKPRLLFHAAILQSSPMGYKYRSLAVANFIGAGYKELLDCEDLRCLQSESADELIHVQDTLIMPFPRSIGNLFSWGPVMTDQVYLRETRMGLGPVANITVRQPTDAVKELRRLNVPVIIGTVAHEGTVFVFSAFSGRMAKLVYQTCVFGFFQASAPAVLRRYAPLARQVPLSSPLSSRPIYASIASYLIRAVGPPGTLI
jgi:hypothetical protein